MLTVGFKVRRASTTTVATPKLQKVRKRSRTSLSTDTDRKRNKMTSSYNRVKEKFLKPYRERFDAHVERMSQQAEEVDVDEENCLFCCHPIRSDVLASLDCGHKFCLPCLEYWFATSESKKCPHGWCKNPVTAINSQGFRLQIAPLPVRPVRPDRRRKYHLEPKRILDDKSQNPTPKTRLLPPLETILKLPCVVRHMNRVVKERVAEVQDSDDKKWSKKLESITRTNEYRMSALRKELTTQKRMVTKHKNVALRSQRLRQNAVCVCVTFFNCVCSIF